MATLRQETHSKLRRNGKRPSCEPCREAKVACDHTLPVCNRCQRRQIGSKCVYHPAPLTMPKAHGVVKRPSKRVSTPAASASETLAHTPLQGTYISPGYLGPTSYLTELVEEQGDHGEVDSIMVAKPSLESLEGRFQQEPSTSATTKMDFVHSEYERSAILTESRQVLLFLQKSRLLDGVILRWLQQNRFYLVPPEWISICWQSVKSRLSKLEAKTGPQDSMVQVIDKLFENTSHPLAIFPSMTATDYIQCYVEENLRWEAIALVLVTVGLGTKHILKSDPIWSAPWMTIGRQDLCKQILSLSGACLTFCGRLGSNSDMYIWALLLQQILASLYYGDSSFVTWAKSADVISAIFAAGLHQGAASSKEAPLFLSELRKQTIVNIYFNDQCISTLLGRPPKLSKRYCVIEKPLDLTADDLIRSEAELTEIISRFEDGCYVPTSPNDVKSMGWGAWNYTGAVLREDILDLILCHNLPPNVLETAENIASSNQAALDAIPAANRYHPSIWGTSRSGQDCLTILMVELAYSLNDYLLQRFLVRRLRHKADKLLHISRLLVSHVLCLVDNRDRLGWARSDLTWVIALFALPPAGVLALELLHQTKTHVFSKDFPRSEVIQQLSVLVSVLAFIADPDDGNYHLCKQAGKLLSRTLDSVLTYVPETNQSSCIEGPQPLEFGINQDLGDWSWFDNNFDVEFWNQLGRTLDTEMG